MLSHKHHNCLLYLVSCKYGSQSFFDNMIINELLQDLINSPEGTELDELVGEHI